MAAECTPSKLCSEPKNAELRPGAQAAPVLGVEMAAIATEVATEVALESLLEVEELYDGPMRIERTGNAWATDPVGVNPVEIGEGKGLHLACRSFCKGMFTKSFDWVKKEQSVCSRQATASSKAGFDSFYLYRVGGGICTNISFGIPLGSNCFRHTCLIMGPWPQ